MKFPALGLNEPLDGTADLVPKDGNSIDLPTRLNYQRCVSNAFHNIGAALYQASKHAAASRFVKLGSQIGSHALRKYHSAGLHEAVDSEKGKLWAQLEEQLYPRWDLLGSCCIKMGERQVMFSAQI
jgi:separase